VARFFIAEDHEICRLALEMTLSLTADYTLVGEAASGEGLSEKILDLKPDVAFIDISLPGANAIQIIKQIKTTDPAIKIVVCTGYADHLRIVTSLDAGADAFLLKGASIDSLKAAVGAVQRGERWIDPEATTQLNKSNIDSLLQRIAVLA
jgi:DNA-binding NarL/FixJ family response regulator